MLQKLILSGQYINPYIIWRIVEKLRSGWLAETVVLCGCL